MLWRHPIVQFDDFSRLTQNLRQLPQKRFATFEQGQVENF
jgi:hypothetical protein